jgi:5'-3' exonuclease
MADKANALMSHGLATIERNVPVDFSLSDCKVSQYDKGVATQLFQEWGFKSLIGYLPADEFETSVQAALF